MKDRCQHHAWKTKIKKETDQRRGLMDNLGEICATLEPHMRDGKHLEVSHERRCASEASWRRDTWRRSQVAPSAGSENGLTSLVFTTPLTYFPSTESTQRRLDSAATHRSLSPTRNSIFLFPRLPLVCSPRSPEACPRAGARSARERERGGGGGAFTRTPWSLDLQLLMMMMMHTATHLFIKLI